MKSQSLKLYSSRPTLTQWGFDLSDQYGERPTTEEYIDIIESNIIKEKLIDFVEKGYSDSEIKVLSNNDKLFTGWAYLIHAGESLDKYDYLLSVYAVVEKKFNILINFSLSTIDSACGVSRADMAEYMSMVANASLNEIQTQSIQRQLNCQMVSGESSFIINSEKVFKNCKGEKIPLSIELQYKWEATEEQNF